MTSELQHYTAANWYFTCQCVEVVPYLCPFQVRLKRLSQGLGNFVQATEKVEQCNHEVISSLAALCRHFCTAFLAQIWKSETVLVREALLHTTKINVWVFKCQRIYEILILEHLTQVHKQQDKQRDIKAHSYPHMHSVWGLWFSVISKI